MKPVLVEASTAALAVNRRFQPLFQSTGINNAVVDHRYPIVDPAVGFTTWDEVIERMFVEKDELDLLCHECHTAKSMEERRIAKDRRAKEKESHE